MKKMILIHCIALLCYGGGAVWGVVEGVDYFVNEDSVNWLFLFPLVGGIVTAMFNMIYAIFKN